MSDKEKEALKAEIKHLREVLRTIPHGMGDHTDLCRMENAGLPPADNDHCHCHVALIRNTLSRSKPTENNP